MIKFEHDTPQFMDFSDKDLKPDELIIRQKVTKLLKLVRTKKVTLKSIQAECKHPADLVKRNVAESNYQCMICGALWLRRK